MQNKLLQFYFWRNMSNCKYEKREMYPPSPRLLYSLVSSKSTSPTARGGLGPGRSARNSAKAITYYSNIRCIFGVIYFNRTDSVVENHDHFLTIRPRETVEEERAECWDTKSAISTKPQLSEIAKPIVEKVPGENN